MKNVFNDIQDKPICWKICPTLVKEPPAKRVAIHRRKLPAAVLVPGKIGWLFQMLSFPQLGLLQAVFITTSVPFCVAPTVGLISDRQMWQNWNSSRSFDKNTMCFGSVLRLWWFERGMLHVKGKIKYSQCMCIRKGRRGGKQQSSWGKKYIY